MSYGECTVLICSPWDDGRGSDELPGDPLHGWSYVTSRPQQVSDGGVICTFHPGRGEEDPRRPSPGDDEPGLRDPSGTFQKEVVREEDLPIGVHADACGKNNIFSYQKKR